MSSDRLRSRRHGKNRHFTTSGQYSLRNEGARACDRRTDIDSSSNYRTTGSSYYEGDDSVSVSSHPLIQEGHVYYSDEDYVENLDRSSYQLCDRRPDLRSDYGHHDYHQHHDYKHHQYAMPRRRLYDGEDPIADSRSHCNSLYEENDRDECRQPGPSRHTSRSDLPNDQDVSTSQQYSPLLMNEVINQESLHRDRDNWTSSETGGPYDNHESHFWSKRNETSSRYLPQVAPDDVQHPPSLMSLNCNSEALQHPVMSSSRYSEQFGHPTQVKVEECNNHVRAERMPPEPLMSLPVKNIHALRFYRKDNLQKGYRDNDTSLQPLMSVFNEDYPSSSYERSDVMHGFEREPTFVFSRLGRETPYTSADESDYFSTSMREPNPNNSFSDLRCTPIDYGTGNSEAGTYPPQTDVLSTYPPRADVLSRLGPENLPTASIPKQHEDLRLSLRHSTIANTEHIDLRMSLPLTHQILPSKFETDSAGRSIACPTNTGPSLLSSRLSSLVDVLPNVKEFVSSEVEPSSFDLPFSKIDGSTVEKTRMLQSAIESDLPLKYSSLQKPSVVPTTYPKSSSRRKPKGLISKNSSQHCVSRTKRSTVSSKRTKHRTRSHGSLEMWNKMSSYSKPSNKTPVDKQKVHIRRLSKSVIGNITEHLYVSSDSKSCLLTRLYNACAVVVEVLSKENNNDIKCLQTLCHHFSGFFCATLVSTHLLPVSNEDLFTKELSHLRATCGNNITKWRKEINKFVYLAGTIANLVKDITVLDERSLSPKSLMLDISSADFVGYRPPKSEPNVSPAAQAREKCDNGDKNRCVAKRLETVASQPSQHPSLTTSTVEVTKPTNLIKDSVIVQRSGHAVSTSVKFMSPNKGSSGDFPEVISMLKEVKPASAEESGAHPVNGSDPVQTQSLSRQSLVPSSSEDIQPSKPISKTPTPLDKTNPMDNGSQLSPRVKEISPLPANHVEQFKCHSAPPKSLEDEILLLQKSYSSQDEEAVYLPLNPTEVCSPEDVQTGQSVHRPSVQDGLCDDMHPVHPVQTAISLKEDQKSCVKERKTQKQDNQTSTTDRQLGSIKDQEYHDSINDKQLPVLVTSNIPVGSLKRTDKGLKSLLEIVMCGAVHTDSTKQDNTPPLDNSKLLPHSQKLCLVSTTTSIVPSESHLVGSSTVNLSGPDCKGKCSPDRAKNVVSKRLERGSLSPGEIVSTSPSPSPPPPLPEQNNGGRKLDSHNKIRLHESQPSLSSNERNSRMRSSSEKNRYKRRPYVQQPSRRKVSRSSVVSKSRKKNPLKKINSDSDDELELLDLRKKALMSMIQDKKSSAPVSAQGKLTSPGKPSGFTPFGQDVFETIDMEICSESDTDVELPTNTEFKRTSESSQLVNEIDSNKLATINTEGKFGLDRKQSSVTSLDESRDKAASSEASVRAAVEKEKAKNLPMERKPSTDATVVPPLKSVPVQIPSFVVKVLPGNEKTWNIEPVHIMPHNDSDSEEQDSELQQKKSPQKAVSRVSQFLIQARNASLEPKDVNVVQPNPRSIPKSMPLLLPTPKKKEYLQLKMKLEMHERKKRLRTHSSKNCLSTSSSPERSRQPTPEKSKSLMESPGRKSVNHKAIDLSLHVALKNYENQLQSYQNVQEGNLSDLNSLTEKLTDCELNIEECDVKIVELEAQQKHLQNKILAAKTIQVQAVENKSVLQTEVRAVKNSVSATGRKIEHVKSEIKLTKASLSCLNELSPISTSTALISLKSFKSSNTKVVSPFPSQHTPIPDILIEPVSQHHTPIPDILIEPVSDCDASTCNSVLEIEPISDSEVSEESLSKAANLIVVEAISDTEMDTSSAHHTDNRSSAFESASVAEENRCIKPVGNSVDELHSTSIITKTCQIDCFSNLSQSTTSCVCLPETIVNAQAASDCFGSAQIIGSSKGVSVKTADYSTSESTQSPKPEPVFVQEERSMQCSLPQTPITGNAIAWSTLQLKPQLCTPVTKTGSVPNLVPVNKIFYNGTNNLFSLGNEPPCLAVSVNNLESLDVESACINESLLKDIQQKATLPDATHSCNPTSSSVCSQQSTLFRNRKQKKPLHMTLKRKAEMLSKERGIDLAKEVSVLKVPTSSNDIKTAACGKLQGAKKRKRSLKNMSFKILDSKRMKLVDNQAKTCFQVKDVADVDSRDSTRTSSGVDKVTVTLQQAFESVAQESRTVKSTQVLKLLQATGAFPVSQATHSISTCSQVDISTIFSRTKLRTDQSSSSVVKMSATSLDVPRRTSCTKIGKVYTPYSSPLLSFSSYMLSPAYRQQEKLQLSSITHSCKLNPKQVLCKFELLGVCKDPKCDSQHLRQVVLSNKEIVTRLVTHTPKMAQCTPAELEIAEVTQPEYRKLIVNKISKYASSVVERYSPKLSDEEIYQFTAHEVNKAMAVDDPKHGKHHFVSFSDRGWLVKTNVESQFSPAVGVNVPELGVSYPERTDIALSGDNNDTPKRRYFKSCVEKPHPDTFAEDGVKHWLEKADNCISQNKWDEALTSLSEGLKKHNKSVELWLCWLRLHSYLHKINAAPHSESSLNDACTIALESTQSYKLLLECIRIGVKYDWKQSWIVKGLEMISCVPSNNTTSHQSLELLLNSALLSLTVGKVDMALRTVEVALFGSSERPCSSSLDLSPRLTVQDRLCACLFFLHVLYWREIPSFIFNSASSTHIPFQLVSKVFFLEWDEGKTLSGPKLESIRSYFKKSIQLCAFDVGETTKACLPLLVSMVSFEATHGDSQRAICEIELLVQKYPNNVELWLLCARAMVQAGQSPVSCLERSVTACPSNAWLFYAAAQLALSPLHQLPNHNVTQRKKQAINWLEICIKSFYKEDPSVKIEPLFLYRKLLGQMVPYTLKSPLFANDVDPNKLGTQRAALWMCYCLLVELAEPSSVSTGFHHQSAVDAFESAVHSLLDRESCIMLWRGYLLHLRSNAIQKSERLSSYLSCTKRCLQAIDYKLVYLDTYSGQPRHYDDYSFHNEIIDLFMSSLDCTLPQKLCLLQSFGALLPNNVDLTAKIVKCAVQQETPCTEIAQSLLATHLAKFPNNAPLWRMAASIEVNLGHTREARWTYQQATDALPHSLSLWIDFLMFEVKNYVDNPGVDLPALLVTNILSKAHGCGVDLYTAFNHHSS